MNRVRNIGLGSETALTENRSISRRVYQEERKEERERGHGSYANMSLGTVKRDIGL